MRVPTRCPSEFSFTVTNADGDATGSLSVDIIDDIPDAADFGNTVEAAPNTNLLIVFDRSGSMREDPGVDGFTRRIDLVRAAVKDMLEKLGDIGELNIKVVQFNTRASSTDWFTGDSASDDALAFLDALNPAGGTSYRAAIDEVLDEYGTPPGDAADGFRNLSFFLTDGNPNPGRGLTDDQIDDYQTLVADNDITSYAVGVGNGVTETNPSFVAIGIPEITEGPLLNPAVILDESELGDALVGSVIPVQGNVLEENDLGDIATFGADGPGGLISITVDGNQYEFDRAGGRILLNGVLFAAGTLLTVDTALGGELQFNFESGDYEYVPPAGGTAVRNETFEFALEDADGDEATGELSVEITAPGTPASVTQSLLSQSEAAEVPETDLAFLSKAEPAAAASSDPIFDDAGGDTILTGTMMDEFETFLDPEGVSSVLKVQASDVGGEALRVFGFDNVAGAGDGDRIDISDVLDVAGFDEGIHDLANFVQVSEGAGGNVSLSIDMTGSGSQFTEVAVLFGSDSSASATLTSNGLGGASLQQMLDDGVLIT